MTQKSRREVIGITAFTLLSALAGCQAPKNQSPNQSQSNGNSETQELDDLTLDTQSNKPVIVGVDYPQGFSKDGISNFKTALGTNSTYYDVNSLFVTIKKSGDQTERTTRVEIQASKETKQKLQTTKKGNNVVEKKYRNNSMVYTRSSDVIGVSQTQSEYNPSELYLIPQLRGYLKYADLSITRITSSGYLVYEASLKDISEDNKVFTEFSPDLNEATIKLTVSPNGLPSELVIKVVMSQGTSQIQQKKTITFSAYNATKIITPSWVKEARD